MNISEIIEKITYALTHLNWNAFLQGSKITVLIIAAVGFAIIIFGFIFSMIPQF